MSTVPSANSSSHWTPEEDAFLWANVPIKRDWKNLSEKLRKTTLECYRRYNTLVIQDFDRRMAQRSQAAGLKGRVLKRKSTEPNSVGELSYKKQVPDVDVESQNEKEALGAEMLRICAARGKFHSVLDI